MNNPARKLENNDDITTADIAQRNRDQVAETDVARTDIAETDIEQGRPRLVQSERTANVPRTSDLASPNQARNVPDTTPLFPQEELQDLKTNWDGIQAAFVDEPRKAVEQADSLVASTMTRLADVFAKERSKLEGQWDRGDSVSTEDLRIALQRYRSFFHRLLAI